MTPLDHIILRLGQIDILNDQLRGQRTAIHIQVLPIVEAWIDSELCADRDILSVNPERMSEISVSMTDDGDGIQCHWHHTFRGEQDGSSVTIPLRYFKDGGIEAIKTESEALLAKRTTVKTKDTRARDLATLARLQAQYPDAKL